jgi:hypothetical protein
LFLNIALRIEKTLKHNPSLNSTPLVPRVVVLLWSTAHI